MRRALIMTVATALLMAICVAPALAADTVVLYVNDDATGANDGTSWDDAYTDLQSALERSSDCANPEIRVAAGTYKPTAMTKPGDPRSASFSLLKGVVLWGGGGGPVTTPIPILIRRPIRPS